MIEIYNNNKQLTLDKFLPILVTNVDNMDVLEKHLPIYRHGGNERYFMLKDLYNYEGISPKAASSRIKLIEENGYNERPILRLDQADFSSSNSITTYQRGSTPILISVRDTIVYMSFSRKVDKYMLIKNLVNKIYDLLYFNKLNLVWLWEQLQIFDSQLYSFVKKNNKEKLWSSDLWRNMRRLRHKYDSLIHPNIPPLNELSWHHPKYDDINVTHYATIGKWRYQIKHKKGADKRLK